MCGVLTEEERALKEKGGSIMAQKEAPARVATRRGPSTTT
ncbi:Dihydrolipoamide acyltransferase [Giardia duodenalis]|uniref:Dihydrolipoamide acyltransferase n=1 Tax=Giardia intestinalis TaxID=5741 RepID=V6TMX6_GIAIN|nr:Dihydrolipoamide acyltransferase [Giardia intestinalis]